MPVLAGGWPGEGLAIEEKRPKMAMEENRPKMAMEENRPKMAGMPTAAAGRSGRLPVMMAAPRGKRGQGSDVSDECGNHGRKGG